MIQRVLLRMTGAVAIAFAVLSVPAIAQQKSKTDRPETHAAHSETLDHCAKACNDCQRSCDAFATHCAHLVAQGAKEHIRTLHTCQDCAVSAPPPLRSSLATVLLPTSSVELAPRRARVAARRVSSTPATK
jgi:hypothetical protein